MVSLPEHLKSTLVIAASVSVAGIGPADMAPIPQSAANKELTGCHERAEVPIGFVH